MCEIVHITAEVYFKSK